MTTSPISKNHEFLKEFRINIEELEGTDKILFSNLVNRIDGISKMKMAIEASTSIEEFLEISEFSQDISDKYSLYQIWLLQHQMNEIIEIGNRRGINISRFIPVYDLTQDSRIAEAAAMFQSEEWQRKMWGKWAIPPYEDS